MVPDPSARRRTGGLLVLAVAAMLVALAWLKPLDTGAQTALTTGLKRALVAFAVVRSLDAAVSLAQESTVSLQPAGVGVTLAAGQLLDPVNDLLEKVSGVLLAASASFGIQLLLLKLGGSTLVSAVLTAVLAAAAWRWWRAGALPRWLALLASLMIVVRFAVPLASAGSELAFAYAMADDYAATAARLQGIEGAAVASAGAGVSGASGASTPGGPPAPGAAAEPRPGPGLLDRLRSLTGKAEDLPDNLSMRGKVESLKARIESAAEDLMRLVAIFVVQTVLLPVLILVLLGRTVAACVGARAG